MGFKQLAHDQGITEATIDAKSPFIRPGDGLLTLTEIRTVTGQNPNNPMIGVVLDFRVDSFTAGKELDGSSSAGHEVGSLASYGIMCDAHPQKWKLTKTIASAKSFLLAAERACEGYEYEDGDASRLLDGNLEGQEHLLGSTYRVVARSTKTKSGNPFTEVEFAGVPPKK